MRRIYVPVSWTAFIILENLLGNHFGSVAMTPTMTSLLRKYCDEKSFCVVIISCTLSLTWFGSCLQRIQLLQVFKNAHYICIVYIVMYKALNKRLNEIFVQGCFVAVQNLYSAFRMQYTHSLSVCCPTGTYITVLQKHWITPKGCWRNRLGKLQGDWQGSRRGRAHRQDSRHIADALGSRQQSMTSRLVLHLPHSHSKEAESINLQPLQKLKTAL